ncbi:eukaryotic translation initiation factor 2 subunit 2-like [Lytechinus pictus]|uniref:eukaryotic translation initiation factor 2 subunit 2-like n=1 Tax=Lytechinus pictus TaxID=7653 RepID=UPI0030B9D31D
MTDEVQEDNEAIFDPSMKKKKKKKKTPFDLDAALGGETQNEEADAPAAAAENVDSETKPTEETQGEGEKKKKKEKASADNFDELDLEDFTALKKKKKKKKTAFVMDGLESALPDVDDNTSKEPAEEDAPMALEDMPEMEDLDITKQKKKKKKKKKRIEDLDGDDVVEPVIGKEDDNSELKDTSGTTWAGTERDYTYDELLTRAFDIMRSKNPDMVTGEKKRFIMRPPQVVRIGTKKSSFVNFTEICKMLHRPTEHLLNFLLAELGTSGSIDGNNQLIIKGRFQQKQMESVLRRYIKEYVTCHTCRSSETFLHKENRLFFLQCERCQSRCSVASIKSGFQALTGKRAQMRAKEK